MLRATRFAIIGYGNIGQRHARLIRQMESAELVAVVDTDSDKQAPVKRNEDVPFYNSLEAFFNDGIAADVLNICTPNGYHFDQAYEALSHNYHVLVEKPLTLTHEACEKLITQGKTMGKQVFCVLQNRYSPPARWLKQVVNEGVLGKIYLVEINCYWNRDNRYYQERAWRGTKVLDGGTLFTQFSHFVDLLIWVFGAVKSQEGRFFNFNHRHNTEFEDSGILHLTMHNDAQVIFTYSTAVWDHNMESSITVIGEKGSLKIGGQYMDRVEHCHIEGYDMPDISAVNPPNDYGQFKGSAANHFYVFDNVVKALNGESYELARPEEACQSISLIEEVYKSRNC